MGDDVIYYNLTLGSAENFNNPYDYNPILARGTINNSQPIIHNPSEYYCSIIRLEFSGAEIPLVGPILVQEPVLDVNKTIFSFTMSYNGVDSDQIFWTYVPSLKNALVPPTGTAKQTFSNYYFLYDYQAIIYIMNTALSATLANLKTKAGTGAIATALAPFFN